MPRLAYGLGTRTRRARPSEKIAFRVIPGSSPRGHLALDGPPRGGAGSARPQKWPGCNRGMSPLGHRAFDCPFMITLCLALRTASQCGRGDRVPPRKSPSAFSPGFPRKAFHSGQAPPGGAGSARPGGRLGLHRGMSPLGNRPLANSSTMMTCLGLRTASQCGRGDRAPPRKSPFAPSPAVSPRGHPSRPPSHTPALKTP
jgi:hypothetical protein